MIVSILKGLYVDVILGCPWKFIRWFQRLSYFYPQHWEKSIQFDKPIVSKEVAITDQLLYYLYFQGRFPSHFVTGSG